jgi:hypothetical protein
VFGTADPVLTGTLSGFLAGDNVTATYARTAGEGVATYSIGATLAAAGGPGVLANYSITSNTAPFTITQAAQTISFTAPATPAEYGSTFTVAPTASSGLTVTVTPSGGCTLAGSTVTMTSGTVDCVLTASQAGDANYAAATDVVHTVAAAKANQAAITLTVPAADSIGAPGLTASASGGSGTGALTYTSTTLSVCTVDVSTGAIAALAMGTCSLTATRAADADYLAETSAVQSFSVTAGAASQLVFTTDPPSSVAVGAAFSVVVEVRDAHGNVATSYSGTVDLTIETDGAGGGSVLSNGSVTAVNGVATFTGLSIDQAGFGFRLQAASGSLPAQLSVFFDTT